MRKTCFTGVIIIILSFAARSSQATEIPFLNNESIFMDITPSGQSIKNILMVFTPNPDSNYILQLVHKTKNRIRLFSPTKKICFWYKGEKHKGLIEKISEDQFFIEGVAFDISKIEKIRVRFISTKIIGAVLGTASLFTTGLGIYIFTAMAAEGAMGTIIGILIGGTISVAGILIGAIAIPMFFIGKKYKMQNGWELKAIQP